MNYGRKGVRARQRVLNSKSSKLGHKLILTCVKAVLVSVVALGIWGISAGIGAFRGILSSTPIVQLSGIIASGEATIVYNNKGEEIDQYVGTNSNRIEVGMEDIPPYLALAFVAREDERFYQHNGVDYKGMIRAGTTFVTSGFKKTQGASTITQQLLKNTIFTEWTEEGDNMVKKIKRKIQEQYLALEVTKQLDKDEILLRYMNAINLGQNTLGVEAASQRYFGKSCQDLTLSECAVIAVITQNPTRYNPISHPDRNAERRADCLETMKRLEFITPAEYEEAMADSDAVYDRISLHDTDFRVSTSTTGSYFSDAVYEQVRDDLIKAGYSETQAEHLLTSGGLRIWSTLDPDIQRIADEEFNNPDNFPTYTKWYLHYALTITDSHGERYNFSKENMMAWFKENRDKNFNLIFNSQDEAYEAIEIYKSAMAEQLGVTPDDDNVSETVTMVDQPQAAFVLQDQRTGYVLAMVGGRGAKEGRRTLNRAMTADSSPGSTFKVLASFAPALDSAGKTLATVYLDTPFNYDTGVPVSNWYTGHRYRTYSIRDAIRESLNVIAVKNLTVITPQLGYDYLVNFGFTSITNGTVIGGEVFSDVRQPLALGGVTRGISPYELNAAYAAIANGGIYVEPKLYTKVTDADGNVYLDNTEPNTHRVIKETTAYLLTDAMMDVVTGTNGTGAAVKFSGMAIAGKTGSSQNYQDVWFAGFTPYYTATIWSGYDNNVNMSNKQDATRETNTAKYLWKAIMQRVHEDLPSESFQMPSGIVSATICSESGKLPNPEGACGGCLRTELFEEGTVPTDICDVHYLGPVCAYDMVPASAECPFKITGALTLPLQEDVSLLSGSTTFQHNEDGTVSVVPPATVTYCQHNAEFYMNPDYQMLLDLQLLELEQRNAAAQAELDRLAQEQALQQGLVPPTEGTPPVPEPAPVP